MSIDAATTARHELEESLERVVAGKRDLVIMRQAIIDLELSREATRQKIGTVDVAVELIRDARDQ